MHSQAREYISQLMKSGLLGHSLSQYRTTSKGIEYLATVERMADRLAGIETRRAKAANSFLL
jgi:predicted transcriptional regulator